MPNQFVDSPIAGRLDGYEGPRTPGEGEWADVCELVRSVFFPRASCYQDAIRPWTMALLPDARENTLVMFHRGQPVSSIRRLERDALVGGHGLRVGLIGAVCTHPDHRGRGLASTILAATLDRFRQDDVDFVYITGRRPLYFAAGANHVALEMGYSIGKGMLPPRALPIVIRPATVVDVDTLISLASAEGTRVIRPREDYLLTLETGYGGGRTASFHLVEVRGVPVAYLLERSQRDGSASVVEVAGDRTCAMAALSVLVEGMGGVSLGLTLPRGDKLIDLLASAGVQGALTKSGGTVKAVDPARTLSKLWPFFCERLCERLPAWPGGDPRVIVRNGRYVIQGAGGVLEIDGEDEMLWLLLGRPSDVGSGNARATGRMRGLVESCLPIGLPSLYLNWI